jgi:hypothetical protein
LIPFFLQLKDHIYALEPEPSLFIGKREVGQVSNYYPGDPITDDEVAAIQSAAEKIEIDILNTRYVSAAASRRRNSGLHIARSTQRQEEWPDRFRPLGRFCGCPAGYGSRLFAEGRQRQIDRRVWRLFRPFVSRGEGPHRGTRRCLRLLACVPITRCRLESMLRMSTRMR